MKKINKACVGALCASIVAGCGQVDTGKAGFFTKWGEIVSREPLSEGLHFYSPFGTDLVTYDIKNQTYAAKTEAFTRDLQALKVNMAVTFNIDRGKVIALHANVGQKYADIIVRPTMLNSVKDVFGKMEAGEIVEKRELATHQIREVLVSVLKPYGINVTLVNITDVDYSDAYEKAVEAKQVAQQNAQKEKNETLRIREQAEQGIVKAQAEAKIKIAMAEADAKATLLKAEADAKAIDMKNRSLESSPAIIEYTLAQQWDGKLPEQMLGNAPVPFLNIVKPAKEVK